MDINYADLFVKEFEKNPSKYTDSMAYAVKRYKKWIKRKDIQLDIKRANHMIEFTETFTKHAKGKWAGQPLLLELWQKFCFTNIYGFVKYDVEKKKIVRVIQKFYLQLPKKTGKSLMSTAPINYAMYGEGNKGAECYIVASDFTQAQNVAVPLALTIENDPDLMELTDIYKKKQDVQSIVYTFIEDDMKFVNKTEVLAKGEEGIDGKNATVVICDEVHEWSKSDRYDNLKSSQAVQDEPLFGVVSTAGKNPNALGVQVYKDCKQVLKKDNDDSWFVFITEPNKGYDWEDRKVWEQVNINLGVTTNMQFLENAYLEAKRNPFRKAEFMSKHLNVFVNYADSYFEQEQIEACMVDELKDLDGQQCVVGIDLSKTTDLTCVSFNFPAFDDEGKPLLKVKQMYFIPSFNIAEKEKLRQVPYQAYEQQGFVTFCDGRTIDTDIVMNYIFDHLEIYDIVQINYDKALADKLVVQLEETGIPCLEVPQYPDVMNEPFDDFEILMYQQRIQFDNPLFLFCTSNAKVVENINGMKAPSKRKSPEHIDGFVACLIAHKESMNMMFETPSDEAFEDMLESYY